MQTSGALVRLFDTARSLTRYFRLGIGGERASAFSTSHAARITRWRCRRPWLPYGRPNASRGKPPYGAVIPVRQGALFINYFCTVAAYRLNVRTHLENCKNLDQSQSASRLDPRGAQGWHSWVRSDAGAYCALPGCRDRLTVHQHTCLGTGRPPGIWRDLQARPSRLCFGPRREQAGGSARTCTIGGRVPELGNADDRQGQPTQRAHNPAVQSGRSSRAVGRMRREMRGNKAPVFVRARRFEPCETCLRSIPRQDPGRWSLLSRKLPSGHGRC